MQSWNGGWPISRSKKKARRPSILMSRTQSGNEAESAVNGEFANIIAQSNSGLAIPISKRATGVYRQRLRGRKTNPGESDRMKAFLITCGTVFGLVTLAHIARAFAEG